MSEERTVVLVSKKLVYQLRAMHPATTATGEPLPGQYLATAIDPHTGAEFALLVTQEMLNSTGYTLMG